LAGIARATTPATAATVTAVRTVRSFVSFMYQVSLINWEWRELRLGIVRE
jgi:hypothetical protein